MKRKIIFSSACAIFIFALLIGIFWYYHPTHCKFNDRFIIGNTAEEIIERYGAFSNSHSNEKGEITYGTYMIRDNTPELIMSYDNSLWFEIYFDDGIAVNVRLQKGRHGG